MQDKLQCASIPESLWCAYPHYAKYDHCQERDDLVLGILDLPLLPTSSGCRWVGGKKKNQGKPVPGWLQDVEPYRKASIYWGEVWRKEGRPSTGWLHDTYSKSRSQYHYAARRAKARGDQVKAEKLLAAALQGDAALLQEMKKIRRGSGGAAELPDTVGGANGELEIVDKFRLVYSTFYNSPGSEEEFRPLLEKMYSF